MIGKIIVAVSVHRAVEMAVVVNITTKTLLGKVAKAARAEGIVVAGFLAITLAQTTGASASAQEIALGAMKTNTKKTTIIINSHQKGICLFGIHIFFVPFGIFLFDK